MQRKEGGKTKCKKKLQIIFKKKKEKVENYTYKQNNYRIAVQFYINNEWNERSCRSKHC